MEALVIIGILLLAWIAFCTTVQIGITFYLLWESSKQPKMIMLPPELTGAKPGQPEPVDHTRNYM